MVIRNSGPNTRLKPPVAPSAAAGPRRRMMYRAPSASPAATEASSPSSGPAGRPRLGCPSGAPEPGAGDGGRDQAGRHVAAAPGEQGDRGAALGVAGSHVKPQGDAAADRRRDAARWSAIPSSPPPACPRHYVRQRHRERGQEEPVHGQDEEHRRVQQRPPVAQRHGRRRQHHEHRPEHGRPDQDLTPRPAVDENPGERADQRVRQVEDREGRRPRRGAGERGRVEEHVGADAGRDDAVTGLRD